MSIEAAKAKINKYINHCIECNNSSFAVLAPTVPEQWLKEILKEINDDEINKLLELKNVCSNNLDDSIHLCDKINSANYIHHIAHIKHILFGLKFLSQNM